LELLLKINKSIPPSEFIQILLSFKLITYFDRFLIVSLSWWDSDSVSSAVNFRLIIFVTNIVFGVVWMYHKSIDQLIKEFIEIFPERASDSLTILLAVSFAQRAEVKNIEKIIEKAKQSINIFFIFFFQAHYFRLKKISQNLCQ